jgi:hypothetical protein
MHIGNPPESGELSRWTTTSIVFVDMAATFALAQAFTSKTSCDKKAPEWTKCSGVGTETVRDVDSKYPSDASKDVLKEQQ